MDLRTLPELTPTWVTAQLAPDETAKLNIVTGDWYGIANDLGNTTRKLGRLVNCARTLHFDIYVGRALCPKTGLFSIWGNPFKVNIDGTRDEVIAKFEEWITSHSELREKLPELRGKVLGCWCVPERCHGEVLLRLANQKV